MTTVDGRRITARQVFANVAPAVLDRLLGDAAVRRRRPEGAQVKVNMLLSRLPRLRDRGVDPARAFAGTFHVNEGYAQLERPTGRRRRAPCPTSCRARSTATR